MGFWDRVRESWRLKPVEHAFVVFAILSVPILVVLGIPDPTLATRLSAGQSAVVAVGMIVFFLGIYVQHLGSEKALKKTQEDLQKRHERKIERRRRKEGRNRERSPSLRIFLSYRRSDSADATGRIYDRLVGTFGRDAIFKDVDSVAPGVDFRRRIQDAIHKSSVMLVVIGPSWLTVTDELGARRIDAGSDNVRFEIEMALDQEVLLIPVLVGGASMPSESELPDPLRELAYRNAMTVRADPDFSSDIERLSAALSHSTS